MSAVLAPRKPLDIHTVGVIKQKLTTARLDIHMALLHAKGNPEAQATLIEAGQGVRKALDVVSAAYQRGQW